MGSGQWAVGNAHWTMDSAQWAVGSGLLALGSRLWVLGLRGAGSGGFGVTPHPAQAMAPFSEGGIAPVVGCGVCAIWGFSKTRHLTLD